MMKKVNLFVLFFVLTLSFNTVSAQKTTIVVAANMKSAMDSIFSIYKKANPNDDVAIIYGSSGKFYEQIVNGAPFDVFFSADMGYPEKLKEKELAASSVKMYAIGKIVLWSKKVDPNKAKMNLLLHPDVKKIAVATPTTAPYGAKAIESLTYYKILKSVESKLVYGENIAQTAQFVAFGAADAGIIALSDALSPKMKKEKGKFYRIPQSSYSPLTQGCVVLKNGKDNPTANNFYHFISSQKAVAILKHFGYSQNEKE